MVSHQTMPTCPPKSVPDFVALTRVVSLDFFAKATKYSYNLQFFHSKKQKKKARQLNLAVD